MWCPFHVCRLSRNQECHLRAVITCRVWKETESQVLGSWNKEARADSGIYGVRGAAVAAIHNCIAKVCNALTLSVLFGLCLGYLGAFRCVLILVTPSLIETRTHCFGQKGYTENSLRLCLEDRRDVKRLPSISCLLQQIYSQKTPNIVCLHHHVSLGLLEAISSLKSCESTFCGTWVVGSHFTWKGKGYLLTPWNSVRISSFPLLFFFASSAAAWNRSNHWSCVAFHLNI